MAATVICRSRELQVSFGVFGGLGLSAVLPKQHPKPGTAGTGTTLCAKAAEGQKSKHRVASVQRHDAVQVSGVREQANAESLTRRLAGTSFSLLQKIG